MREVDCLSHRVRAWVHTRSSARLFVDRPCDCADLAPGISGYGSAGGSSRISVVDATRLRIRAERVRYPRASPDCRQLLSPPVRHKIQCNNFHDEPRYCPIRGVPAIRRGSADSSIAKFARSCSPLRHWPTEALGNFIVDEKARLLLDH